jgi:hypothetical protein
MSELTSMVTTYVDQAPKPYATVRTVYSEKDSALLSMGIPTCTGTAAVMTFVPLVLPASVWPPIVPTVPLWQIRQPFV